MKARGGGIRVVFLLDVRCTAADVVQYHRSLCFECIKGLFSLSDFPSKKCLKWKLVPLKFDEPVMGKISPFANLNLDSIENLFNGLRCHLLENADRSVKPLHPTSLSSALATVVQGCLCDSPDFYSPPRKQKGPRSADPLNIVFVCSRLPGQLQQILSSELHECLLKQNIHMICLSGKSTDVMLLLGGLPFSELIPQPASASVYHRTLFSWKQMEGNRETQQGTGCSTRSTTELFCLSTSTERNPLCVIQVQPALKSTSHCSFVSCIQTSLKKCGVHQNKKGNFAVNHAVIVGVIKEHDVKASFSQMNYSSHVCIGLSIDSSFFDEAGQFQQSQPEALNWSKQFSQEYQHLCVKLASKRLCLLLDVRNTDGYAGLCIMQPWYSVMSFLTVLKPQYSQLLASAMSSLNPMNSYSIIANFEKQLFKPVTYPEFYHQLVQSDSGKEVNSGEEKEKHTYGGIFTIDSLLPWYPFSEHHGLSTNRFQHIKELQKSVKAAAQVTAGEHLLKVVPLLCKGNVEGEKEFKSARTCESSLEQIIGLITASYGEEIRRCGECLKLQEWVANNLEKIQKVVEGSCLLPSVHKFLLLSTEQLEEKYAKGFSNNEEKMTEYLLQVFLRLEVNHISVENLKEEDIITFATEVTCLLRKISLMAKPSFLGQLMKEFILPSYSATCQVMLLNVYEGLLLPVPVELGGSCLGSPEKEEAEEDSLSSNEDGRSVGQLPAADVSSMSVKMVPMHSFMRHASFQDQRQIVMPTQKWKKGEAKDSVENQNKADPSPSGGCNTDSTEHISDQASRRVCRSLFKRSMSLNVDIGCKRQRDEDLSGAAAKRSKVEFVVKETPVKKQVENYRRYKLQRLRSKVDVGDAKVVDVVQESPRRSFYTSSLQPDSKKRFSLSSSHMKELLQGKIMEKNEHTAQDSWKPEPSGNIYASENPLTEETKDVVAESPLSPDWHSTQNDITTSDDPSVVGDSASMVAFALSTPTKDDKFNFENALERY